MKKALLTATVQQHIVYFHFPLIDLLHENGYEVHVAARDVMGGDIHEALAAKADKVFDIPFDRSPLGLDNKKAYRQLKKLIDKNEYDLINCNTPMGGIITRLAAKKARKHGTKVIYTAHGFHFYKGASKAGWLIYYPIERLFGKTLTDGIVTICNEDEATARAKKLCKKIYRIHGVGVNTDRFFPVDGVKKLEIRRELGLDENATVCLCTGELNENKNQKLFIGAVPEVLKACSSFKLLLAGAGDKETELRAQIESLGIGQSVTLLGHITNIDKFVMSADFVCSASLREGLPVNIIEAMCCSKPAVVTRNRGHNELVADGESGFFVPTDDSHSAASAIIKLCDSECSKAMGENAFERSKQYTVQTVSGELRDIYFDMGLCK